MTVTQLERRYRTRQRKNGVELFRFEIKGLTDAQKIEINNYCELRQISRSEYVGELIRKSRSTRKAVLS